MDLAGARALVAPPARCPAAFKPCTGTAAQRRHLSAHPRPQRRAQPVAAEAAAASGSATPPQAQGGLVAAGPPSPPPDYSAIDAQPLNRAVYGLFRRRMVAAIGADSPLEG